MQLVSEVTGYLSGLTILVCAGLVTYEVISRYFFLSPHSWSLETNVFLLVGATFMAAAFTQLRRGHVGTEVLDMILPSAWIPWRILFSDILSFVTCGFIGVETAFYAATAWRDNWRTDSLWAPPLWIPYALIAIGMILVAMQCAIQITEQIGTLRDTSSDGNEHE